MVIRFIYEWETCTGAIRRLRFKIVNIEAMQHRLVAKYVVAVCMSSAYEIIGTDWSLKYGGILDMTYLWCRILKLKAWIPLLADDSFRKERFSMQSFLMPTSLKCLWPAISKTIVVSLYSFVFGCINGFTHRSCTSHVVLKWVVNIVLSECDGCPKVSA